VYLEGVDEPIPTATAIAQWSDFRGRRPARTSRPCDPMPGPLSLPSGERSLLVQNAQKRAISSWGYPTMGFFEIAR